MKYIKHVSIIGFFMCFLCIFIFEVNKNSKDVMSYMPITNKVILLDAGHGGIDPGATNEDKSILEKDINLQITLKLRELLESSGCLVLLTREEDTSLYEEEAGKTTRQKYNENLKNRRKMIEESGVDAFVSIHLNKFEQSKYYGAQTFYPEGQNDSKLLSQFIQDELKRVVDKTNQRKIKPSKDIYLLKENKIPSVLIECGFLSNEKESKLLNDEKYQEKVAWAVYAGIQKYFGSNVHN
ncbi:N-acetylmuramoyl-L-alanine amidase CwlD [Paraclostridium sordellii]|uniref:N-acetylmuramoyl-L-alanine amidase CwlD n=1 Tax=Paraclostridium sordellii TaxID=1505 RepID=UPI001C613667|nr:N-acetylmuramoyl-L-alanine amidase CwlD [Paeniclostridium sordellii]QYE98115.1 N-acetylmuramoyl-L-alanine amidase CwlD [Paeniclostridium sordellii]